MKRQGNSDKNNIPQLVRIIYVSRISGNQPIPSVINSLQVQMRNYLFTKLKSLDIQKIEDIEQSFFLALVESFDNYNISIWKETKSLNPENEKKIFSYIKTMLQQAERTTSQSVGKNAWLNLNKVISRLCLKMLNEGLLNKNKMNELSLNKIGESRKNNEDFNFASFVFWDSSGRIEKKLLLKYLLQLFYLEKSGVTISYLTEKVMNDSGYRTIVLSDQVFSAKNEDDQDLDFLETISDPDEAMRSKEAIEENALLLISEAKKRIKATKFETYAATFYLYYFCKKTYMEISDKLSGAIGKSSVENYIKEFTSAMNVNNFFEQTDSDLLPTLHSVAELLNRQYYFDEKYGV